MLTTYGVFQDPRVRGLLAALDAYSGTTHWRVRALILSDLMEDLHEGRLWPVSCRRLAGALRWMAANWRLPFRDSGDEWYWLLRVDDLWDWIENEMLDYDRKPTREERDIYRMHPQAQLEVYLWNQLGGQLVDGGIMRVYPSLADAIVDLALVLTPMEAPV